MPPWSSRLLSPNSRDEENTNSIDASPVTPARARARARISEAELLDNAYGIPSLPPPPHASYGAASTSASARTHGHGRSKSNPFPSIFAGKKKRQGETATVGFESTDDDTISPVAIRNMTQNQTAKQKVPDKDLKTGKCMTCDSMVRWPRELKVFRCTVCLTINDLRPITLKAKRGDDSTGLVTTYASTSLGSDNKISFDTTRHIIDQCITTYLLDQLKHVDEPTSSSLLSHTMSPMGAYGDNHISKMPDKSNTGVQLKSPTRPIALPRRPINQQGNHHDFRHISSLPQNQTETTPFSNSSPENYFAAQMNPEAEDIPERSKGFTGEDKKKIIKENRENCTKSLFKPLEDYLVNNFGLFECVNASFSTLRPTMAPRAASEGTKRTMRAISSDRDIATDSAQLSEMDAKTLLLGNFAENGSWWTGNQESPEKPRTSRGPAVNSHENGDLITLKSPHINWAEVREWYHLVLHAGTSWRKKFDEIAVSELHASQIQIPSQWVLEHIEDQFVEAESHLQRVLLKITEGLLKRPGRPLREPSDLRFLLILLANPLLYPAHISPTRNDRNRSRSRSRDELNPPKPDSFEARKPISKSPTRAPAIPNRGNSGQHSGIIKRIMGLLSNVSNECHHHLVSWFARYSDGQFQRTTDLIGSFVTYRLMRQNGKKREIYQDPTAGLIPSISGSGPGTSAALHAALGVSAQSTKKNDVNSQAVVYNDDWQIKAAARVMALFFSANNSRPARRGEPRPINALESNHSAGLAARERARSHGQIIPTSDFYNTLLDYSNLIADFEAWESRRGKFAFCQYPFFLSIWAKIQIMEHDARRQMEVKAREAFFDSIMTHKSVNQYLFLRVRRECLVEDSLKSVSEVVGTGGEEIKKGLRIEFRGEEGIDAGGLRKEWFLLLVRDVFNPEHGIFTYDEDSQFCYFNANSFETTDQFFLVGVVLGLAIYNSTILDVALPPFAFRKLLAAGPAAPPGATSHTKTSMTYSHKDLAEYRPALANGLRQLLEYDGDVETTFCRDFVADVEQYGQIIQVPLCPDGEKRAVTNTNRREFVDLYVRYLLDIAVARQFEPFKRGFFTVCGGNALSLFRPEEIELLIRGSDEPLDIASLKAVSVCENWASPNAAETESVIHWFWQSFTSANPKDQRKLLSFITGSDRIPAMGATNLIIKLSCLGEDCSRFPVARTCFNVLSLYRYSSRQKLEYMLWRAVSESEGFGLK